MNSDPMFQQFAAFWILCAGASVGSFLNVVVYRMPAGLSIVRPGSFCPLCRHTIRWYDNVPVFSWFILRGRCRDCRSPFSVRYAGVEAFTAALFVVLAVVECFSGTANLPHAQINAGGGSGDVSWGIYAYHLVLLTTLICAGLIEFDGKLIAWPLAMPALVVGLGLPVIWSGLHPVPVHASIHLTVPPTWLAGAMDGLAGLVVGLSLGWLGGAGGLSRWSQARRSPIMGCTLCGVFLGWQAVCGLAGVASIAHLACAGLGRMYKPVSRISWPAILAFGALLYITYWKMLSESVYGLHPAADWRTLAVGAATVLVFSTFRRMVDTERNGEAGMAK